MELDHVGVATRDATALAALYGDLLDAPAVQEETVAGTAVTFLDCGGCDLELLEPREGGAVAEYLEAHGPGLHHVAFHTGDLAGALDRARQLDLDLVDESPRPGARGHEVAFLHPRSTGGVLVEFVG
jgi:methylmalonyl-CoA/ethylmalonyl-CoA epimerase